MFFVACSTKQEWLKAEVSYPNKNSENLLVKPKDFSYYTYIKSKSCIENNNKTKNLIPEETKKIQGKDFAYVSMFFDEENYGMESWSFGRVIAGDTIMLVETKFQAKTCSCKTSGRFFHGYFIVFDNNFIKIKTDKKNNIYNRQEIYNFVQEYYHQDFEKQVNSIEDLKLLIKNINN